MLIAPSSVPTLATGQTAPTVLSSIVLNQVEYWHKDHLGSLVATTDHAGALTARYAYDPFGKRRSPGGSYDDNGTLVYDWNKTSSGTDRGYTGHEHLDDVGIIHMNGRLFDPRVGVFMQGDPFIQDPLNLQNFNRYAYCYNNPMTCTDPSGLLFNGLISVPVVDNLWNNHIKPYAPMIASIAISIYLPGADWFVQIAGKGMMNAAITGFVSGIVASGNLKGGLQGAFTAGMFYGVGNVVGGGNFFTGVPENATPWGTSSGIALHGVAGCVTSVVSGNQCAPGALSAAFAKGINSTSFAKDVNPSHDLLTGTITSSIVGGTASVLGGGKFSNGAATGAFSYLFNDRKHPDSDCGAKLESVDNPLRKFFEYLFPTRDSYSPLRLPDYVTITFPTEVPLTGISYTLDRAGDLYIGPSVGFSLPGVSGRAWSVGWTGDQHVPVQTQLINFISGDSYNVGIGLGGTSSGSGVPGSGEPASNGWNIQTPGLGWGRSWMVRNIGIRW